MKNHAGMEKNIGIEVGEEKRATAARSMIYQVFSTIFSYPSEPQTAENIINGSMQDSLMELALDLPYASPFQDSGYGIECPVVSEDSGSNPASYPMRCVRALAEFSDFA